MGMLVEGKWQNEDVKGFVRDGKSVRFSSGFHGAVREDGSTEFKPEIGRYALYYNRTCPWSHRAAVTLETKGLSDVIDQIFLEPARGEQSWWFGGTDEYSDPAIGATHLHELYSASRSNFTGRVSVPILWDKKTEQIVNNDSGAIARMFNCDFNKLAEFPEIDFYPEQHRAAIDELNDFVAENLNDGVYRCLLAKSQTDYETAFDKLFTALDALDERLAGHRYLLGDKPTEPDWRLFAGLVRFDAVYYPAYKCNLKRIIDYPRLWDYTRDLYQLPNVAGTVDMVRIKAGYYGMISPSGIIPKGPILDFEEPHERTTLSWVAG
ncbi:MAG: putative glutathione S-transferase [Gammaproteobacteria bacterium]|jgi:putative glutathione S-transferase